MRLALRGRTGRSAVGSLVVLLERGSPAPAPPWSEWEPPGSPERRVAQIAHRVPDPCRLPSGNQLATVTYVGLPTVTGPNGTTFQVRAIAVRPDTAGGAAEADDIETVNAAGTVMYNLYGLGSACSIPEGSPTDERGALLRREALELSLYTLEYVPGADSALVMLPPRPDGQASTAVFLERGDVRPLLSRPLDETLTSPVTPSIGELAAEELRTVERLTRPRLYAFSYLQGEEGSPIMVLTPVLGGQRTIGVRERGCRSRKSPEVVRFAPAGVVGASGAVAGHRAALTRAKARLDRPDYYPRPVRIERVRVVAAAYALWRTILVRGEDVSDDLLTHELCHVWQGQNRPLRSPEPTV